MNDDAGFETADFRSYCDRYKIIGNIDRNKRSG